MHPKLALVRDLAEHVRKITQSLVSQLLQELRLDFEKPEAEHCLRIVGYLRRTGVYSEYELRLQFLKCRQAWLTGMLEDLDEGNPDDCQHVLNNVSRAVEGLQLVLDSHRWVPVPAIANSSVHGGGGDDDDAIEPPYCLMEHPPLAVFVNGVAAAMNELRPCAPLSLKHVLAKELIKGLKAVSDYLMTYNAETGILLRENTESELFLSLCQAFIENTYPHCAKCFGRCYTGVAASVMDAKSSCDGIRSPPSEDSLSLIRTSNW
ncbi:hypothetical protein ACLB2K_033713 [Fragaria x ananassa]